MLITTSQNYMKTYIQGVRTRTFWVKMNDELKRFRNVGKTLHNTLSFQVPLTCSRARRRTCSPWPRTGTISSPSTRSASSRETSRCAASTWATWTGRWSSSPRPWKPSWICTRRAKSSPASTPPGTLSRSVSLLLMLLPLSASSWIFP